MNEPSDKAQRKKNLVNGFRAYLQTIITAEQSGQLRKLSALPGPKMVDYCFWLAESGENILAHALAAPVLAILTEIESAAFHFYLALFHKSIKDPVKQAHYERTLKEIDFALAIILTQIDRVIHFRAIRTKSPDLILDVIWRMNKGKEAARLIRRYQRDFPELDVDRGASVDGGASEQFAWDTYERVAELDRMVEEFQDYIRPAARQMQGWPMLVHRHTGNKKRFQKLAAGLELGAEYPLDASESARFRPDTPLARYLAPIVYKLTEIQFDLKGSTTKSAEDEAKALRARLWDGSDNLPTDEEVTAASALKDLPALTKGTAARWAEKVVVPFILATDARDWQNCEEAALRRIVKQKGVKSRATFKSRLLSAVSASLQRLARPG